MSYNEGLDTMELKPVLLISENVSLNCIKIKFKNGESIVLTEDHPVLVKKSNYLEAKYLVVGQEISGFEISEVSRKTKAVKVYNLKILDNYNFLVSPNNIVVKGFGDVHYPLNFTHLDK